MSSVSLKNGFFTRSASKVFCILLLAAVVSCGGSKKITTDQLASMSSSDRIAYLDAQARKSQTDINLKRQLYREYLNAGMTAEALGVMEDILVLDPTQLDVQFEYGELQYKNGNTQAAYRAFLNVLEAPTGDFYMGRISNYVSSNFLVQSVTASPVDEGFPAFSPDGSKLVFQKRNQNGNWDIVEFDLQTRAEAVLTTSIADEESPVYSPDGLRIAYTSTATDRRPIDAKYKVREITLMERSDRFAQNLTQSVADDWLPRYSHGGGMILFVSERSDLRKVAYNEKQSDLYIMENDGDFQHRLTDSAANEGGASFSADDLRIYFHSNKNGVYDIYSIKTNGEQMMTLLDSPGNDVNPFASPNGESIVFMSDRDGNYELYRARVDGSNPERLTFHPGTDANPVYSPDGRTIAFHSDRNGNFDIFVINLDYQSSAPTKADIIQKLRSQN